MLLLGMQLLVMRRQLLLKNSKPLLIRRQRLLSHRKALELDGQLLLRQMQLLAQKLEIPLASALDPDGFFTGSLTCLHQHQKLKLPSWKYPFLGRKELTLLHPKGCKGIGLIGRKKATSSKGNGRQTSLA